MIQPVSAQPGGISYRPIRKAQQPPVQVIVPPSRFSAAPLNPKKPLFSPGLAKPSFARRVLLILIGVMAFTVGTAAPPQNKGGTATSPYPAASDDALRVKRPRDPSENIGWIKNVKVMASSGMDYTSQFSVGNQPYGYYTKALLDLLRSKNTHSFEYAQSILEKQGYKSHDSVFFPPSTNRSLESWNKDEKKPRFAVLIGQLEGSGNVDEWSSNFDRSVMYDLNNMESALKDKNLYNLPASNILRYNNATKANVKQSIQWLREKLKQNPGAEVLLYYSGHGDTTNPKWYHLEGDSEGELSGPGVQESELKAWVKDELGFALLTGKNPAKLLIILDTCYAGSETAL